MILDIVIPTLNESKNLEALLPYLKSQLVNTSSTIIVVDAVVSSDNSDEICRKYDVNYIKCGNCQRGDQMNRGSDFSNADIIMFLHADVRPPENFSSFIIKAFKDGFKGGMFAYRFDKTSVLLDINSYFTKHDGLFTGGGDQCLFIEKKIFEDLGKFDSKYVIMEDFDFFKRLKKARIPYTIIQEKAIVSSRKYQKNSYLRVNLANLMAFLRFEFNVSPVRIRDSYRKWLN